MDRKIAAMEMHVIVAGPGSAGAHVMPQIVASGRGCVLVERDADRVQKLLDEHNLKIPFVVGDATDNATLQAAGILARPVWCSRSAMIATTSSPRFRRTS